VTDLADHTTLGLGGPAKTFIPVATEADLIGAVRAADAAGEPVLLIGGGSNLVIADEGFPGTVIAIATRGIRYEADGDGRVAMTAAAGEDWDDVVAGAVARGLAGLECLSGIPGRSGATPIQNVGAYGQEVAEAITTVRVFDRLTSEISIIPNEECRFSYRNSLFKAHAGLGGRAVRSAEGVCGGGAPPGASRYVVLDVTFGLARDSLSMPVKYAELASEMGVRTGERVAVAEVRSAVLKIRARKGMVLSHGDPDSKSAGSFFTNPVLSPAEFAGLETAAARAGAGPVPRFDGGGGRIKVPAAWLIEHAGFGKGYGAPGRARVSSKHTLALVNAGGATTADLLALAREIRSGVHAAFGVTLDPEPTLVGVTL
jgi:UDP-N-acetylenolpyruvoylglucosamine reductase